MTNIELLFGIIGVVGTGVSIYQWAQINATKERFREIQFLMASIHSSAIMKQVGWQNQLSMHVNPLNEQDKELFRTIVSVRDDFAELANLVSAMEGAISAHDSAISEVMKKVLEQSKLNNELQAEGLKNPSLPSNLQPPS